MSAPSGFVLDASVAAAWLLPDEHGPAARRAYAGLRSGLLDVHAPELWLWECGNLIANAVRRKRLAAEDAMYSWSVLDAIRTRVELAMFEPGQVRACLGLAVDHGLSVYGAAYLWLAASLRLPLLTHDRSLADAARALGVESLSIEAFA